MANYKYSFGRWQYEDSPLAYIQIHGYSAVHGMVLVGYFDINNIYHHTVTNNEFSDADKYNKKSFKSQLECLDYLNGEIS